MLKSVVTDIATVPEDRRSFYVEKDGKFVLQVEAADGFALENVTGLKTALESERANLRAEKDKFRPFEGLDAAAARAAIERVAAFGDVDPQVAKDAVKTAARLAQFDPEKEADRLAKERFENSKAQLLTAFEGEKTKLAGDLTETKGKLERTTKQLNELLKNHTIATELTKLEPIEEARDVLEMMAGNFVRLVETDTGMKAVVVDGAGNPRTKTGDASSGFASIPVSVAEMLAEMKESKKALFKPSKDVSGLGTNPQGGRQAVGGEANPYRAATRNLTQQALLEKKDPAKAARLKAEAAGA
jgi:hypothetical protein